MANIPIIRVTLGTVTTDLGTICTDPTVTLIGHPNVYINCVDAENGVYEVQLPDDTTVKCLEFKVICDDCRSCDPQIIEKCFCDDDGDCPDCSECDPTTGFCDPLCTDEFCLNGECVDCTLDKHCPCNQICDANGNCVCPEDTELCDPNDDCCYECCEDNDCPACYVCIGGDCVAKDCPNGVCDPSTGNCVDCVTNDQCDTNECCEDNECVCCDGYVRDNCTGECVAQQPNACQTSEDCPVCSDCTNYDPCTGYGVCTPTTCPPGFVPVEIDGECICAEECDCDNPGCPETTEYCKDFGSDVCACVDCEGDCTNGCEDPCYCNPQTNECEENPCQETNCTNGLDCGEGCGCDPVLGVCVPCSTLDCTPNNCDQILGCECVNDTCQESDGCTDIPCSVGDDCPEGCGCYEGQCVACDNFPCAPDECSSINGCECVGGDCVDDGDDCSDTLTVTKDDSDCSITGTLVKSGECQCPKMTLDSKGQISAQTDDNITLNFIAEVRKGAFDGVSVDSVPRVDEFTHPNIAENEPPTSGTIQLAYTVTYDVFDDTTGVRVYQGETTTSPITANASYPGAGNTAQVSFTNITLPKIGSETVVGNIINIAKKVVVTFTLVSTLEFPNDCDYAATSTPFAKYTVTTNSNYTAFPTSGYGNGTGDTISSPSARKPFFKWTKSADSTFNESPFKKIYVTGTGTTFVDVLTDPDEVDSCFHYLLESDCTCAESDSDYVVFCNPRDLDFTLTPTTCPNCITINSFNPCTANTDQVFRVVAGSVDITFTEATAPIGTINCSTVPFTEVVYSMVCDEEDVCTKTYAVAQPGLVITPTVTCSPDNTEITVTFPNTDDAATCNVQRVEIGGFTLTGPLTKTLASGSYTAVIYWDCGCDPTIMTVQEDCCGYTSTALRRNCNPCADGDVDCYDTTYGSLTCVEQEGVQYMWGNSVIMPGTVCQFLSTIPDNQSVTLQLIKGDCPPRTVTLASLESFCCENFAIYINQINQSLAIATVSVTGGFSTVTVTAYNNTTQSDLTVVDYNNGTYGVTGYNVNDSITVFAIDDICGTESITFVASECDLDVTLEEVIIGGVCRLQAVSTADTCECRIGRYNVDITSVTVAGSNLEIDYTTSLDGFDSNPISGQLYAGALGNLVGQGIVSGSGTLTVPIETTESEECFTTQVQLTLQSPCPNNCDSNPCDNGNPCQAGCLCDTSAPPGSLLGDCRCTNTTGDLVIHPTQGVIFLEGSESPSGGTIVDVSVTANGSATTEDATRGIYTSPNCCAEGDSITIIITATDDLGNVYTGTYVWNAATEGSTSISMNLCSTVDTLDDYTEIQFSLQDLQLEDNCEYPTVDTTFRVYTDGDVYPNDPQDLVLNPLEDSFRFIKFVWSRGGVEIFEEFVGAADSYTSLLPFGLTVVGDTYTVSIDCPPCNDEETIDFYCIPDLAFTVNGCNLDMDITLTGNPGNYEIIYDMVTTPVTIPASGTTTINIAGAPTLTEESLTISVAGIPDSEEGCKVPLKSIATDPECAYTPSYAPTVYIPSYTPSLYTPTYATPTYTPIYTPIYAPSYATPTYTPIYTPIYTPTYATPTYAPIYAPHYTPIYTQSPIGGECLGCTSSLGVCCNDIPSEGACDLESSCFWTNPGGPGFCDCDTTPGSPIYAPSYAPIYVPGYAPIYTPIYLTPSYTPIYAPVYTPNYVPIYTPVIEELTPAQIGCRDSNHNHTDTDGNVGQAFIGITIDGIFYATDTRITFVNSVTGKIASAADQIAQFIGNTLIGLGQTFGTISVLITSDTPPSAPFVAGLRMHISDYDGSNINIQSWRRQIYSPWTPTKTPILTTNLAFLDAACTSGFAPDATFTFTPAYTPTGPHPAYTPT